MSRTALVSSLVLLLAVGAARAQDAPAPGAGRLGVDARLGLGDGRSDVPAGWAPVSVVLVNDGPARPVEVEVAVRPSVGEPWTCRREVSLSQGQRWRGWFHVPLAGAGVVDVVVWPAAAERPAQGPVEPIAREANLAFSCWDGRWRRAGDAVHVACVGQRLQAADVTWMLSRQGGRWSDPSPKLGLLSPDVLPDRAEGYTTVQLVALRDVDLTGLSPAQQEALVAWVERGGRALLIPGRGPAWFRDPVVGRLLGGTQVTPLEVDALPTLELTYGPLAGVRGDRERFVVYEVTGARRAAERHPAVPDPFSLEERLPGGGVHRSVSHVPHGRGCVDVLSADPALAPFDRWPGRSAFAQDVMRAIVSRGSGAGADPRVDGRILTHLGVRRLPARGLVVVLVVAFVVLVGPVNYLLLRRRQAQMLLVATVPLLSLGWTGLVFVTGYATKGLATITRVATLIDVDLGGRAAHEVTALALTAAGDGEYEVAFGPGVLATRVGRHEHEVQQLAQHVWLDDAGSRQVVPLGPWTQAAFRAERTRLLPGGLALVRAGGALELHNDTDLTVVSAVAYHPIDGVVVLTGPVAPGARARLPRGTLGRPGGPGLAEALVAEAGPRRELVERALGLWSVALDTVPTPSLVALVEPPHAVRVDGRAPDVQVALLHARGRAP